MSKPKIRFKGYEEDWEQRKLSEIATMHARIGWQNLRTSEFLFIITCFHLHCFTAQAFV